MLDIGSILHGRYKITGILSVRKSGHVYPARDMHFPSVQRHVAIKELRYSISDLTARDAINRAFEQKAQMWAELNHSAIPKIFDYFLTREAAYLVMQYIDGRDLEAYVNARPDFMPVDLVVRWAIELCDVLAYLHSHEPDPVVFHDLMPSNIMIDRSGRVHLVDFGMANVFQVNRKTRIFANEGYAPPEQLRGSPPQPTFDIYALGAILHHLLTRNDPRTAVPAGFRKRRIRTINPKVSPELDAIVMRALRYRTADRFTDAAAMKKALAALQT